MKPTEILNALMSGTEVKLKETTFKSNKFTIYQIEQGSVNLYNELTDKVFYEILFDDISLF